MSRFDGDLGRNTGPGRLQSFAGDAGWSSGDTDSTSELHTDSTGRASRLCWAEAHQGTDGDRLRPGTFAQVRMYQRGAHRLRSGGRRSSAAGPGNPGPGLLRI